VASHHEEIIGERGEKIKRASNAVLVSVLRWLPADAFAVFGFVGFGW
jgi:hypothetical protein